MPQPIVISQALHPSSSSRWGCCQRWRPASTGLPSIVPGRQRKWQGLLGRQPVRRADERPLAAVRPGGAQNGVKPPCFSAWGERAAAMHKAVANLHNGGRVFHTPDSSGRVPLGDDRGVNRCSHGSACRGGLFCLNKGDTTEQACNLQARHVVPSRAVTH